MLPHSGKQEDFPGLFLRPLRLWQWLCCLVKSYGKLRYVVFEGLFFFSSDVVGNVSRRGGGEKTTGRIADPAFDLNQFSI